MKVKDLIEFLKLQNLEAEFIINKAGAFYSCYPASNQFRFDQGDYVTDKINETFGHFVSLELATSIQNDGRELLDLTSETIVPALCIFEK